VRNFLIIFARFHIWSSMFTQKYETMIKVFVNPYLVYIQIWLNLPKMIINFSTSSYGWSPFWLHFSFLNKKRLVGGKGILCQFLKLVLDPTHFKGGGKRKVFFSRREIHGHKVLSKCTNLGTFKLDWDVNKLQCNQS